MTGSAASGSDRFGGAVPRRILPVIAKNWEELGLTPMLFI